MSSTDHIRSLILAGGRSSRMGSPKCLLETPISPETTTPLVARIVKMHQVCQGFYDNVLKGTTTISTRDVSQTKEFEIVLAKSIIDSDRIQYVVDQILDRGPAAGLIAAYDADSEAHWLVTGCDYPLLESEALTVLVENHLTGKKAITCFRNALGWNEPLLAIWSPAALGRLQELSAENATVGPNRVIRELAGAEESNRNNEPFCSGVRLVTPSKESWVWSVNTREDWEDVLAKLTGRTL